MGQKFKTKYGYKIRNMDAAIIEEFNLGIRPYLSYSKATVPNSLLTEYLLDHGLTIAKGSYTKDLIGINFNFGRNEYDQESKKIDSLLENASTDREIEFYSQLKSASEKNKDKYEKITKQELRTNFYNHGVEIDYGNNEKIKYVPLYRSSGRAKLGSCTFVNEKLYDEASNYLRMGMKLPEENLDITGISAYQSLAASSIKDRIYIDPNEVLTLKDVDSIFRTKVISVETDQDKHCITKEINDYPLKNTLFDGQGLIDSSVFPEWAEGYVLLRNHFTKLAAFHCDIQQFFKDYFKDEYETAIVEDMFGRKVKVSNIKLITTDNAFKWIKMGMPFEEWAECVRTTNKNAWGVVKSVYKSKFGNVQRMSYQMINALDMKSIDNVIKTSKQYIEQLKKDDQTFIEYLRRDANYSNDFDVLADLYEHNPLFARSSYFRERRKEIIRGYTLEFKNGRILQNSDNLVICGNPFGMLMYAAGLDPLKDPTFSKEDGAIQVWTARFDDDTYLASFRSPFNSQNNLCHLHNCYHEYFDRYFHGGRLTVYVNMIETDFQARNNGSDQDSDTIYVTDQEDIVRWARTCLDEFPTIENNIPKETNSYRNTMDDFASVDNKIAAANRAIGESSNLAQLCLTYGYNFDDPKFKNYACILAVLAQVAIDNAKRSFDIDLNEEIRRIKTELNIKENGLPLFWFYIKRKGKFAKQSDSKKYMKGLNQSLVCPMNYLCEVNFPKYRNQTPTIPIKDFLINEKLDFPEMVKFRTPRRIEKFIEKYSVDLMNQQIDGEVDNSLMEMEFDELLADIRSLYMNKNYRPLMLWLIKRCFRTNSSHYRTDSQTHKNRSLLLKVLYSLNPKVFLSCFKTENEMTAL